MDMIKSLNGLIETLKISDAEDFVKIAKNMHIPVEDFKKYMYWKDEDYSRNCIIKTDEFELILLCWKKGNITSIHGHDNQKCWIYQVDGEMTEIRYKQDSEGKLTECNRILLTPGKLCYMHDTMGYHLLKNHTDKKAMTLHLYMKPVDQCEVYNSDNNCFEERILGFDTVHGEKV